MPTTFRPKSRLRLAALAVLAAGLLIWVLDGARLGWTQTSTVQMQTDEITGIEYPVHRDEFVAGIEVPALAAGLAAVLVLAGAWRRRSTLAS